MNKSADILLVEDNPTDAELMLRAVKKSKLQGEVHVVRDGAEALDYLFIPNSNPRVLKPGLEIPRVIFLDLKLPKVNGLEVLRELKANDVAKTIPVVVLTSSQEERDILESYNLGVNSYIVKPVDFETYIKTVNDLAFYWLIINKTMA